MMMMGKKMKMKIKTKKGGKKKRATQKQGAWNKIKNRTNKRRDRRRWKKKANII